MPLGAEARLPDPEQPHLTRLDAWTEKNGRIPLWPLAEKEQLELRQQFAQLHTLVLRLSRGPWPGPDDLARLKDEYAAPTRRVLTTHLQPALARLSAFLDRLGGKPPVDGGGEAEARRA
jgi:hypothetical protein